jgi:hypothetical protein
VFVVKRVEAHIIDSLARDVVEHVPGRARAALVPDQRASGIDRAGLDRLVNGVMTFSQFYDSLDSGRSPAEYLPALAFWRFGPSERHPAVFRYMDDCENYVSAGLRFTLLGVDPDTLVGLYAIETDR